MADLPHLADVEDIYNLYDENRLEGFVHQAEEVLDEAIDVSRYHQVHLLLMLENCAADTFDMSEYLQRAERVYAIMVAYEDRTDPEVEPALEDLQQRIQRIQRNIDQKPWGALQKLGGGAGELAGAGIGDDTGLSRSYDGAADDDAMDTVPELGGDGAADERDDSAVTTRAADINTAAPPINANEEVAAVAPDSSIMTSGEAESSSVVASPTEEPAQEPKVSAPGPTRTPGPVAHALRKKPSIVAAQVKLSGGQRPVSPRKSKNDLSGAAKEQVRSRAKVGAILQGAESPRPDMVGLDGHGRTRGRVHQSRQ